MEKVISVTNLRKQYKKEVAVENVSFELERGSIMGLLGPNGAGKTTTLKMITNLCFKDEGKVVIHGVSMDYNAKAALSKVGAALDTPSFYNELTAKENLECFAALHKASSEKQVMELLDLVGLKEVKEKKVKAFSLGMKQRLGLARAMLGEPELIILDEPANGLDPQGMVWLYRMIGRLARERKITFLVSSHLLHDMEALCTDVLILHKGKSILQGKTQDVLAEGADTVICTIQEVREFENMLLHLQGIRIVKKWDDCFTVRLEGMSLDAFIKKIVERNLHILSITKRQNTLQELFLKLTGGAEACVF